MALKTLQIYELKDQGYVPSPSISKYFAEAASVCLENQGHKQSVVIKVSGEVNTELKLEWEEVTQQMKDNWADLQEATEYGATGLAILLVQSLTDYRVIQRSPKTTGFDYWLGEKEDVYPFQKKARLEVSGILQGTRSQINRRLKEKLTQVKKSDATNLPALVVVVEFSQPICEIVVR